MNHSPAQVIRQLLIDALVFGNESANTWPSFVHHMPDSPKNVVSVHDRTGILDGRLMDGGEYDEHPGIQIMVRSSTFEDGWVMASAITTVLDSTLRTIVGLSAVNYLVQNTSRTSPIIPLGTDPKSSTRQEHFSINLTASITQQL